MIQVLSANSSISRSQPIGWTRRLPDGAVWSGGVNYLVNVCKALRHAPEAGYEPVLLTRTATNRAALTELKQLLGRALVVDDSVPRPRSRGTTTAYMPSAAITTSGR